MMPEPEENRLDQSLRSKFDDFDLVPGAPVWAGIEARLGPAPRLRPRRRPLLVPLLFMLTAVVAGLGGWLLPHGASRVSAEYQGRSTLPQQSQAPKTNPGLARIHSNSANRNPEITKSGFGSPNPHLEKASPSPEAPSRTQQTPDVARESVATVAASATTDSATAAIGAAPLVTAAETVPVTVRLLAALERQTLVQLPSIANRAPGALPGDSRAMLLATLRTERAELFRLQRRTDSLLLALGDLPGTSRLARTDTAQSLENPDQLNNANRWSLLLTATPEQNTLAMQGPESDSLTALRRNHETGRAGFSAGLLAEYKLTPRLSVGGGVGYTALGADLRITNKTTDVRVRYDSTTTHAINTYTSTHHTYSIRIVQVPQLSPVFNPNGQVIRYDTVYVPRRDTVFTTTVQHDTVRTSRTTVNPHISKKETLTTKLLQPNYRFFTVPVLLRYRLATPGNSRLWTDVAVGAQLQFFLGGTQVATDDGEHFRTERISVASSPFRALNVALSGSLALNYALTPRLSVSVAPSMRWQALSLYKPETGLRQQATSTGLMFGVRFGL